MRDSDIKKGIVKKSEICGLTMTVLKVSDSFKVNSVFDKIKNVAVDLEHAEENPDINTINGKCQFFINEGSALDIEGIEGKELRLTMVKSKVRDDYYAWEDSNANILTGGSIFDLSKMFKKKYIVFECNQCDRQETCDDDYQGPCIFKISVKDKEYSVKHEIPFDCPLGGKADWKRKYDGD